MLTGDSERTAAAIAAQVGVDEYRSEVLPEDKANFVEEERAKGRTVVMLGDGINDSPALSAADVGIAVSDGAAIAREIADITVSSEDLRELVRLRRLSCELMKRIHANYRFVLGFNGTLIGRRLRHPPRRHRTAPQCVYAGHQPAQYDQSFGKDKPLIHNGTARN